MARIRLTTEQINEILAKKKKPSKYKNKAVFHDGMRFASTKEGSYYLTLKNKQSTGEIKSFLRQIPLHLPGGIRYVVDFMIINNDDTVEFIECKGYMTQIASMKIKQASDIYKIKINIV